LNDLFADKKTEAERSDIAAIEPVNKNGRAQRRPQTW